MNDNTKTSKINQTLTITPTAIEEIKRLLRQEKEQNLFLRLGVSAGGCSGMSYSMAFDDKKNNSDIEFTFDNINVVVNTKAMTYLKGMILDYKSGLLGGGFHFDNPNASRSCGCGTSFSC